MGVPGGATAPPGNALTNLPTVPEAHPSAAAAADPGTVRLEALAPFRIFVQSGRCCSRVLLDGNLQRLGENLDSFGGIITCENLQVVTNAVANGGGIAFLSSGVVRGLLDDEILRAHYVEGFAHYVKRTLVVRKNFRPDMRRAVFLDAVFSAFNLDTPPTLSARKDPIRLS